jgi:hypothetical protein
MLTFNARISSIDRRAGVPHREKIPRRLDPARPHEQELRRDAAATGQAAPQRPGALIPENPEGESP